MIEMTVPAISCGHCAGAVTQACKRVDPAARVEVDIAAKKVKIASGEDGERFAQALKEAGYAPAN